MALGIQTNVESLNAQRQLSKSSNMMQKTLERLSSGLRINSAKDDAAGLAISERFGSQIRGMNQAVRNANDGISLSQTAEGALGETSNMLQRIRELAIQSANATNTAGDRAALNAEVQSLTQGLQRVATTTQFNGQNVLDGSFTSAAFQVGANANQTITATSGNFQTNAYGNYRIGGMAVSAQSQNGVGDLTVGSTAEGKLTTFATLGATASANVASTFTISNSLGSKQITTTAGLSAEKIAAEINKADTGVKASGYTSFVLGADDAGTAGFKEATTYTFQVATDTKAAPDAFTTISFTVGGTASANGASAASQLNAAVQAFNDVSGQTGFTAKVVETDSGKFGIQLTSETGKDLRLANISGTGKALMLEDTKVLDGATGTVAGTKLSLTSAALTTPGTFQAANATWISGQVILDSDRAFSLTTTANNGVTSSATTIGGQLQSIDKMDVSTVNAANRTLAMVNSALATVSNQRSRYGALQNRLESTIANLQTASENASAANSRIRDADFAAESANLTKGQIMQQAGTAMLAQANQLPQQVLSLIR